MGDAEFCFVARDMTFADYVHLYRSMLPSWRGVKKELYKTCIVARDATRRSAYVIGVAVLRWLRRRRKPKT